MALSRFPLPATHSGLRLPSPAPLEYRPNPATPSRSSVHGRSRCAPRVGAPPRSDPFRSFPVHPEALQYASDRPGRVRRQLLIIHRVGSPRAVIRPRLPQIRTCRMRQSDSSGHGLAAGRHTRDADRSLVSPDFSVRRERRVLSVGEIPTRPLSFQPVAIGTVVEVRQNPGFGSACSTTRCPGRTSWPMPMRCAVRTAQRHDSTCSCPPTPCLGPSRADDALPTHPHSRTSTPAIGLDTARHGH